MGIPFFGKQYYYIITKAGGELFVLGPYNSENEARQKGFEKLSGILYDIKKYPTRDLSRATRMAKYGRFDDDDDMDALGARAKHKL